MLHFFSGTLILLGAGFAWFAAMVHAANYPGTVISPLKTAFWCGLAAAGLLTYLLFGMDDWWRWILVFLVLLVSFADAKDELEQYRTSTPASVSDPASLLRSSAVRAALSKSDRSGSPASSRNASASQTPFKWKITGPKLDVIQFCYLDAKGEFTYRRVVVREVSECYLKGRCLERKASRTFRLDRIIGDITSEVTGEVASPDVWVAGLVPW